MTLFAIGGRDDPGVPIEGLTAWAAHGQGDFPTRIWEGGHMFLL